MQNVQQQQCLQTLHNQIITGNCLIAELYRLSLNTPFDFLNFQTSRFSKLLIDFSYFENRASFDKFTEQTEEGRQLEEKFFASFTPFLNSFARFIDQLYTFLTDFIDYSREYVDYWRELFTRFKCLDEIEILSAQLLHILGLLLVLFDFKFPAVIRERIFVALALGINIQFISQMILFLRFYKGPKTGWLENCVYICLYFEEGHQTLKNQFSIMRQLIDNYFNDRWILHFHVDFKVNLHEKWEGYKAANAALQNVRELWPISKLASSHLNIIQSPRFPSGLLTRIVTWLESVRNSINQLETSSSDNDKSIQLLENICTRISSVTSNQLSSEKQQNLILHHSLEVANSDLRRLQNIYSLNVNENNDAGKENALCQLTDFSSIYLFLFVDENCLLIEKLLREDPLSVRFIFLKLTASVPGLFIHGPSTKIPELFAKKLSFYYKVLEVKLRLVVQAIPRAIFEEMNNLNQYFSPDSQSVWIEKNRIEQFADLPRRRKLAELTYKISRLAMGIAQTCIKELGGDVEINPRALLSDGLCNELKKRLVIILSADLPPLNDNSSSSVFGVLERRRHLRLRQFRKAFLFVCEHVGIRNGIQIWAEQMHSVTRDCLARKLAEEQMPSPNYGPSTAVSFSTLPEMNVCRFFDFMLSITKPNLCIYNPSESTWRSVSDRSLKFAYTGFASLENWMLSGLATLTGLILHNEINAISKKLSSKNFTDILNSCSIPLDLSSIQKYFNQKNVPSTQFAIDGNYKEFFVSIAKIGQLFILLANLHVFVDAEVQSQLGVVWKAASNFWSSLEIDISSNSQIPELSETLYLRSNELVNLLPKFVFIKSSKSQLFLLATLLHFLQFGSTTISTNKRREFLDSFAVIQGCHPFDTVKVRLQTMPRPINGQKPLYTGAIDCARQTVTKEGFFALYKGMAAPLVGVSPLFAVFFGGTAVGKWLLQKDPNQKLTFSQNFTAGAIAGIFTTSVMVPDGPVDVVKKLYKEGGIKSIYRGTGATLLRDIPASGAYISVYEFLKAKFS
uniref:Uncharacterized protein n=1 Tax=Meloidogyne javanica TaxID=6303 RepID=A0A915M7T5_MELJA